MNLTIHAQGKKQSIRYMMLSDKNEINPAQGVKLERSVNGNGYHQRRLDIQKTLTLEQVQCLVEKSKETKIYIMVLLNVLMGLRRSEILGIKYSDIGAYRIKRKSLMDETVQIGVVFLR